MRRAIATLAVLCAGAAAAPAAQAGFFPAEQIDGPSADIVRVNDIDVAREGESALAYLKREAGLPHVFVARMTNGAWGGGERLDAGQGAGTEDPHVAVADDGRAVASWINNGQLWTSVRTGPDTPWSAPILVAAGGVERQSLDMSVHGVGYVAWAAGGDVRAARLAAGTTQWTVIDPALDFDAGRPAGGGRGPDMSALADGTGLAVWEEVGPDGRVRIFGRRVIRTRRSEQVRELSVDSFEGRPGRNAVLPDAGTDDDSSFGWAMFQQTFEDGGVERRRVLARRLVGSDWDPPVAVDTLGFPAGEEAIEPRIDVNGRERSMGTLELAPGATTVGVIQRGDLINSGNRIDGLPNASASSPVPAQSPNGTGVFAWFDDPGGPASALVSGRHFNTDDVLEEGVAISNGDFGPAVPGAGIDAAADRASDVAVAFVQGGITDRRVVVAHYDRPLRAIALPSAVTRWQNSRRPRLTWSAAAEFWGRPTYRVDLNGFPIAMTQSTAVTPAADLPDGSYPVRITSIDRRGQETQGPERQLRVDATKPIGRIRTSGPRRRGRAIRFIASARDLPPPTRRSRKQAVRASGIAKVSVTFGDRTRAARSLRRLRHTYRRAGRYKVRLVIDDRAGNRTVVKLTIRVGS